MVEFGPMVSILVSQCNSKERFNRLTAINWVQEFINLGGDQLLLFYSELLGAIMFCISDADAEIRLVKHIQFFTFFFFVLMSYKSILFLYGIHTRIYISIHHLDRHMKNMIEHI